ncbi:MAG: hypothetical protein R3F41_17435 [Gammaproteobacteria bacterium]|nr:hypothetical protein [Pseudomonadales bacterium]MCP5347333.1 hypothetical protein [Pseudomonadales bacterium]
MMLLLNSLFLIFPLAMMVWLQTGSVGNSVTWRAMVTPLASIIGSGFLVIAPVMGLTLGRWALPGIAAIVCFAYLAGSALRYNIVNVEPLINSRAADGWLSRTLFRIDRTANLVLAVAYVIAITFYLELLGAFLLSSFGTRNETYQKVIAMSLMLAIAVFGLARGLKSLEDMETVAVNLLLAIICSFLLGLLYLNFSDLMAGNWSLPRIGSDWNMRTLRELSGIFLIVQGFETSRFMQSEYPAPMRVRTMARAQILSGLIYIVFIALSTIYLDTFEEVSETSILELSARVASLLPLVLILGAVMSQFSSAIADTIGTGGLVEESTGGRVERRWVYAGAMLLAVLLLWSGNIFAVIAYASRAFALYYCLQCVIALLHSVAADGVKGGCRSALFLLLALALLATALFAIPADSTGLD